MAEVLSDLVRESRSAFKDHTPVFSYNLDGTLDTITYSNGATKTFSYSSGQLAELVFVRDGVTITKTFNYTSGVLTSISEAIS